MLKNSNLTSPKTQNQKIIISLAPADLKKEGPVFDVPIALSYLLASEQIIFETKDKAFVGELSLSGKILPVKGILPMTLFLRDFGIKDFFVPEENREELGSKKILEKVLAVRKKQEGRFVEKKEKLNSKIHSKDIEKLIVLDDKTRKFLNEAAFKLNLSPRSFYKVLKLALTISDLEGTNSVELKHVLEALQYRPKTE